LELDRHHPAEPTGGSRRVSFDAQAEIDETPALAPPYRSVVGAQLTDGASALTLWQAAKKAVEMWKTELLANSGFSVLRVLAPPRGAV
jgi:hypothetical protein